MPKKNNQSNRIPEVANAYGRDKAAKAGLIAGNMPDERMAAEGEATAEDLGNATIKNKYNSSK